MERVLLGSADNFDLAFGRAEFDIEDLLIGTPEELHERLYKRSASSVIASPDEITDMNVLNTLQALACFNQGSRENAPWRR
jgi:hypothetical protein